MILTCPQFVEMVTSYKEGALGRWDRVQYRAHLLRCRGCRTYVAQIDATVAAAGAIGDAGSPRRDELLGTLASRLRARAKDDER